MFITLNPDDISRLSREREREHKQVTYWQQVSDQQIWYGVTLNKNSQVNERFWFKL